MTMRIGVAALAAGLVLGGAAAPAQTTTGTLVEPEALASPEVLSFAEEQEAVLRDYIRRRPVEGLNRYAYVVSPDDKIVVVDPTTRRVVHVMDR
jgi:hypothetical protein